jgi:hypothetical protein
MIQNSDPDQKFNAVINKTGNFFPKIILTTCYRQKFLSPELLTPPAC